MDTRVDMKVSFEDCDVTPFIDMCYLLDLKYYDLKCHRDVVLNIIRVIMVESI